MTLTGVQGWDLDTQPGNLGWFSLIQGENTLDEESTLGSNLQDTLTPGTDL